MYKVGEVVEGVVTGIQNYGAFISLEDATGLVHISEVSNGFVRKIEDFLEVGKTYTFYVIDVDENTNHIKLSYKKIHEQDKKERYKVKSNKNLARNEYLFDDTFKVVKQSLENIENDYLTVKFNGILNENDAEFNINQLDFVKYLNEVIEKDTNRIRLIGEENHFDNLVVVSRYERFDLFDAYIDFLGLSKTKLIYLDRHSSIGCIKDLVDELENKNIGVLFIFDGEYTKEDAAIYRLFRKSFEEKNVDIKDKFFFSGIESDQDLESLINKEGHDLFIEPNLNPEFSICAPSSLFVLSILGLNPFDVLQGFRLSVIKQEETGEFMNIANSASVSEFTTSYSTLHKLVNYYKKWLNLAINVDLLSKNDHELPKYKDGLKKLQGLENNLYKDANVIYDVEVYLKQKDLFTLTYLLCFIYLIICYKKASN